MGEDSPSRVIFGAYPHMGFNEDAEACSSGNWGFDVTNIWGLNGNVISETESFVETDLMPAMAKAAEDARWSFATAARTEGKFRKHGICATGKEEDANPAWNNSRFPRYRYTGGVGWASTSRISLCPIRHASAGSGHRTMPSWRPTIVIGPRSCRNCASPAGAPTVAPSIRPRKGKRRSLTRP